MSATRDDRIRWTMRKRVPRSTLILAPEGGTFRTVQFLSGEDLGVHTTERVFACVAAGETDAANVADYLDLSKRTVWRHVRTLRSEGRLTADGPLTVALDVTGRVTPPVRA